jgi:hypothetical protein
MLVNEGHSAPIMSALEKPRIERIVSDRSIRFDPASTKLPAGSVYSVANFFPGERALPQMTMAKIAVADGTIAFFILIHIYYNNLNQQFRNAIMKREIDPFLTPSQKLLNS